MTRALCLALLALLIPQGVNAFRELPSTPHALGVVPRAAPPGAPRTITFTGGCAIGGSIDETQLAAGILLVRATEHDLGCTLPPHTLTYTPRAAGTLRVILRRPSGADAAEAVIETAAAGRSATSLDGMWRDLSTDGSGISFHHNRTTDAVFGTWFMFNQPVGDEPQRTHWYSIQQLHWSPAGNALDGIVYSVSAGGSACALSCPQPLRGVRVAGSVRIAITPPDTARIEAFDPLGKPVFSSTLTRLAF